MRKGKPEHDGEHGADDFFQAGFTLSPVGVETITEFVEWSDDQSELNDAGEQDEPGDEVDLSLFLVEERGGDEHGEEPDDVQEEGRECGPAEFSLGVHDGGDLCDETNEEEVGEHDGGELDQEGGFLSPVSAVVERGQNEFEEECGGTEEKGE